MPTLGPIFAMLGQFVVVVLVFALIAGALYLANKYYG